MTVESPGWLLLLAGAPLAAALAWTGRRRAAGAVAALMGAARGPRVARAALAKRVTRGLLLAVAVALLALAAAGLRWGREAAAPAAVDQEVTVLLDLSYSMRAADVAPSRLHAAAAIVEAAASSLAPGRVGLTVFRGGTLDLLPPTADRRALAAVLAQVTEALPPAPTPAQVRSPAWAAPPGRDRRRCRCRLPVPTSPARWSRCWVAWRHGRSRATPSCWSPMERSPWTTAWAEACSAPGSAPR